MYRHYVKTGDFFMGVNDVIGVPYRLFAQVGEKKLVQPGWLLDRSGNFVKYNGFLSLKRPFLGEYVDVMSTGNPSGDLLSVSLGPPRIDKSLNEYGYFQFAFGMPQKTTLFY